MAVRVTYPGVYVQEVSSGTRSITGVSTSTALFVGMTPRGPMRSPKRVLDYTTFARTFGEGYSAGELPRQVQQFFVNGGREAWVVRVADGDAAATLALLGSDGSTPVLTLTARDSGGVGNLLRAEVDYETSRPESTFRLILRRLETDARGALVEAESETFSDLSMDRNHGRFVERALESSRLASAKVPSGLDGVLTPFTGYSISGLLYDPGTPPGDVATNMRGLLGSDHDQITIRVDGGPPLPVTLGDPTAGTPFSSWETAINAQLASYGTSVTVGVESAGGFVYLVVRSTTGGGHVEIGPAVSRDAAVILQLGTAQGGLEVHGRALQRPIPTGLVADLGMRTAMPWFPRDLGALVASSGGTFDWSLGSESGSVAVASGTSFAEGGAYPIPASGPIFGSLLNVRANLAALRTGVATSEWEGRLGEGSLRLHFRRETTPDQDTAGSAARLRFTRAGAPVAELNDYFEVRPSGANVARYRFGLTAGGTFHGAGVRGDDGGLPRPDDYDDAYQRVERAVPHFTLLVLPRARTATDQQSDSDRGDLWGPASVFCQGRRAFLIVDPRSGWRSREDVMDRTNGVFGYRRGAVGDHAALYWPRLRVATSDGLREIDPAGSIAGLMARTDASRGVWKAPAGIEADIRGVRGVEHPLSDEDNGIINQEAVNAIRDFPNGITSWGARTLAGTASSTNTDYRYVPVRRLALYIEESLYRGLKFAVFEPNAEPLWAQLRMTAGSFMHRLFRQGAFKGAKARDAYFVKVDRETTTADDINQGVVNVVVGFAPVKPAEFVVVTIRQLAGQDQV